MIREIRFWIEIDCRTCS